MTLFYVHASLMTAGFILFLAALWVAATLRRRQWWLMVHRNAGVAATAVTLAGAVAALVMVSPSGGHFQTPHAWMGLLTIILALATPLLGFLQTKLPSQAARRLRILHRPSGRLLNLAALITILMGLRLAGLL